MISYCSCESNLWVKFGVWLWFGWWFVDWFVDVMRCKMGALVWRGLVKY